MIVDPLSSSLSGIERLPAAPAAARPAAVASRAAESAPAGEPSALWDLLTPDEQAFFTAQASRGPLTYRPARRAAPLPAGPTGQRLDRRG